MSDEAVAGTHAHLHPGRGLKAFDTSPRTFVLKAVLAGFTDRPEFKSLRALHRNQRVPEPLDQRPNSFDASLRHSIWGNSAIL